MSSYFDDFKKENIDIRYLPSIVITSILLIIVLVEFLILNTLGLFGIILLLCVFLYFQLELCKINGERGITLVLNALQTLIPILSALLLLIWAMAMIFEIAGPANDVDKIASVVSNYGQIAITLAGLTIVGVALDKREERTRLRNTLSWCSLLFILSAAGFIFLGSVSRIVDVTTGMLHDLVTDVFIPLAFIVAIIGFLMGILLLTLGLWSHLRENIEKKN